MNNNSPIKSYRLIAVMLALALVFGLVGSSGSAAASRRSYIVQSDSTEWAASLVKEYGGEVTSRLEIIRGVGALLTPGSAAALREMGVRVSPNSSVELVSSHGEGNSDGNGQTPATDYPDVVGADYVWSQGYDGTGVTVAIVDTGLGKHPGLFTSVDGSMNTRVVGWMDFVENSPSPRDKNGHGTHVAGIIANTEIGADGERNGVAPGVNLVGVRVLDESGYGSYERVIEGIQWVIANKDTYNIKVMNLSLVSDVQSPYWADPLNQAVTQAWAAGITVVVAAGNDGPGAMTIGVPGNNPYVITVGSFTDNYTPLDWSDDFITPFSSAGPTLDAFVKPDVVAPGGHIVSTMLPGSQMAREYRENRVSSSYFSMAGTSQSAAVVSGIAALVASAHPELNPNDVKYRIQVSSFIFLDLANDAALYSMWQQGSGRVNAPDAVLADIVGTSNQGMDIQADLAGDTHYEGFSYFDEQTGEFHLLGGYGSWAGGYGSWAGGYGTWAGGYGTWAGGYGTWAGSLPWAETIYVDPAFAASFMAGEAPDTAASAASITAILDEP